MSDNPVKWTAAGLTPAGNALQAALLGTGDGLTFTRAAAADAEGVERLDLTLQSPCTVDGPKCRVPVLLTNAGVTTAFTMTELRFYVRRVTDGVPTGEEILYATVTDETGDPIPTAAQSPGFTIDWAFVFQYGNAGSVTVTLDPVGLVSIGMVGQPGGVAGLGDNGAVPIEQGGFGGTTAQEALANLGAGAHKNLFCNGDFSVNQRGKTEYTGFGYSVDGVKINVPQVSVSIQSDGIIVAWGSDSPPASGIEIPIEAKDLKPNTKYTLSVYVRSGGAYLSQAFITQSEDIFNIRMDGEGIHYHTFTSAPEITGYPILRIWDAGREGSCYLGYIKLEEGEVQTTGYQDNSGQWHLFQQNDVYSEQLARCQRYFQLYESEDKRPTKAADCRPVMRIDPTPGTIQIDEKTYYYNSAEM